MTIVCARCASPNSRWEKRCYACWLPIDAALRTGAQAPVQRVKSGTESRPARARNATLTPFAEILSVEAEHVRALAAADIRTLEDIAQAPAETIEDALLGCAPIDPEILIARAHQQLHGGEAGESGKAEPQPAVALVNEPNPDEWWKMR